MIPAATCRMMMSRMALTRSSFLMASRAFSSDCEPAQRLKDVLNEYRLEK